MSDRQEFIFSDMSQVEPKNSATRECTRITWQMVDYTSAQVSGTMITAHGDSDVPKVSFNPALKGWYQINVGIYQGSVNSETCLTQVKLRSDKYPVAMEFGVSGEWEGNGPTIIEAMWKYADLTNEIIEILHPNHWLPTLSNVAYFRFIPMEEEAVAIELASRNNKDNKRIYATHDIHWAHSIKNPKCADDLVEEIQVFKDTDVERLFLEYLWDAEDPDSMQYFWDTPHLQSFPRPGDRNVLESKRYLTSRGINYYPDLIKYGHEIGIKVSLSFRMNAFAAESPYDKVFATQWYNNNPQLHCTDIDHGEIARMSYAYPEVQEVVLHIFKRILDCGADGVHMLFNRGLPCLLYEKPLVDAFREATGKDAFALEEEDTEFILFRARYFTDHFLRRVRVELDAYAKEKNYPRPFISIHAHADKRTNLFFALDLESLALEGLIDAAVGYPTKMVNPNYFYYNRAEDIDRAYYGNLSEKYGIHSCYDIMPRRMEPDEYRKRAIEQYESGCDRICMWDSYSRSWNTRMWTMARRIGHKSELGKMDCGEGTLYRRFVLRTLNGLRVDKYNPFWGL